MIRTLAMSLAALAGLSCAAASAQPLVRMEIVDRDSGRWLEQHSQRRDTWIAGMPGHRYAVRLTNTSGERVLVVLSVDGVNAVTGQTADPSQAGYVLAPWQSTEIPGWRKSHHDVAQFVFTALTDSYAARTGRPDNVGTIGIAAFRERGGWTPPSRPSPPIARDSAPAKSRSAAPVAEASDALATMPQRIGTGHGEREWSPAGQTSFQRTSRPDQVTQLRYDSPGALAARGIVPQEQPWSMRGGPQAFPGGFVADPPQGWR
ncbi:hypothetical protein ACW5EG_13125 [Luteimonas sp. A611]